MSILKIAPAFIAAKRAFGPALKDKTNPAYRSKYADLGACLEAVDGALLDNGIALYQETSEDPTGVIVETVLLHESGEILRCGKLHVPAVKQDPQGYGSALTYARRYSIMAACGIAPEDDDGNAASKKRAPPVAPAVDATPPVEELADDPLDQPRNFGLTPEKAKRVRRIAEAAMQKFNENDEWGAFEEWVTCKDNAEKSAVWSILKPHSALRTSISKHVEEQHRRAKAMDAIVPVSSVGVEA